jgi:hypothetical protein
MEGEICIYILVSDMLQQIAVTFIFAADVLLADVLAVAIEERL